MTDRRRFPVGTQVRKFFHGYGWFQGQVVADQGVAEDDADTKSKGQRKKGFYLVEYEDEDEEECTGEEIATLVKNHLKFAAASPKKETRKQETESGDGGDTTKNTRPTVFARYPIGTRICNLFEDGWFYGKVVEVVEDNKKKTRNKNTAAAPVYKIKYEDGDCGEYQQHEMPPLVDWGAIRIGRRLSLHWWMGQWKRATVVAIRPEKKNAFRIQWDGNRKKGKFQWVSLIDPSGFQLLEVEEEKKEDGKTEAGAEKPQPPSPSEKDNKRQSETQFALLGSNSKRRRTNAEPTEESLAYSYAVPPVDEKKDEPEEAEHEEDRSRVGSKAKRQKTDGESTNAHDMDDKKPAAAHRKEDQADLPFSEDDETSGTYYQPGENDDDDDDETSTTALVVAAVGAAAAEMYENQAAAAVVPRNVVVADHSLGGEGLEAFDELDEEPLQLKDPTIRDEFCSLCRKTTMANPRALPCHHLFCQACIEQHFETDHFCPFCQFPAQSLDLSNERTSPDSFRPVESICIHSGKMVDVFTSASSASTTDGRSALKIIQACQSRRRDEKKHQGFYWRFVGSNDRILKEGEAMTDGFKVEQICLTTGKILATFSSRNEASRKTGVHRQVISRVLKREGNANGGGFFWRYAGETHDPWEKPPPKRNTAVEQLDLETGQVVAEFASLADAKKAMKLKLNSACIRETCDGKRLSAYGFFWRWIGSNELPRKFKKTRKRVEARKSKDGQVIRKFDSANAAAEWIEVDENTLCKWCSENLRGKGYFWSYSAECNSQTNPDENGRLVKKRIRLLRPKLDKYMEGKVMSYDPTTRKHSVRFDNGDNIRFRLDKATFEMKKDHGQRSVEKLSLDTGEVLKTFESVTAAGKEIVPGSHRGVQLVSEVLSGKCRQTHGFFYRYQGSSNLPRRVKNRTRVQQCCPKTGRVLATYESIKSAADAVKIDPSGITCVCKGYEGHKSAGGFGWRYYAEYDSAGAHMVNL